MSYATTSAGTRIGIGLSVWLRMFDFRGRSTRTEVFSFYLVTMLLGLAVTLTLSFIGVYSVDDALRGLLPDTVSRAWLGTMLGLLPLLPMVALLARRLHDIGLPGWPGPLLFLITAGLSLWHELASRPDDVAPMLPAMVEGLRLLCFLGVYAILFWAPQLHGNRYGPDPRIGREDEGASATEPA